MSVVVFANVGQPEICDNFLVLLPHNLLTVDEAAGNSDGVPPQTYSKAKFSGSCEARTRLQFGDCDCKGSFWFFPISPCWCRQTQGNEAGNGPCNIKGTEGGGGRARILPGHHRNDFDSSGSKNRLLTSNQDACRENVRNIFIEGLTLSWTLHVWWRVQNGRQGGCEALLKVVDDLVVALAPLTFKAPVAFVWGSYFSCFALMCGCSISWKYMWKWMMLSLHLSCHLKLISTPGRNN